MCHNNIVIISAHPDDMEIGMGGTVAKLVESKAVITSIAVTNGGRSSNPFALTEQRIIEVRREEALRAASVLGVKEVIFYGEPDAAGEVNTTAVKRRLIEILARLRPTEVYRWMRRVTDIQPIVLSASWRGKACVKPASR
ncbi:MAG TPA: PIG-L family deacetylase [Nitrospiraceae bacterium]|nr:PIG-L family deacetylase [Nitrospiraceae bacterium]